MTFVEAKAISDSLRHRGFWLCTAAKVKTVAEGGYIDDPALESAILEALDRESA